MEDISFFDATELGEAFKSKKADPVDVVKYFLSQISKSDDKSIFVSIAEERARSEAKASAIRYAMNKPLGPLDGVPVVWKDLIDIVGLPTTCGAEIFRYREPPTVDAKIVQNCTAAGMIVLGKVNLTEFAFSGLGLNPHYGTPVNPHSTSKICVPGGSSSGSAVSVAAGLAPIGIGTDTGGSVRIPAAFNGLVGYKSSEGHIDKSGIHPLSHTLDTVGPIAKSVNDCVLMERVLRGEHVVAPRSATLEDVKLLVPKNLIYDDASDCVIKNFERCLELLVKEGIPVRHCYFDVFDSMIESSAKYGTLATAESFYTLGKYIDGQERDSMDQRVVQRVEMGRKQTAIDYITICEKRKSLNLRLLDEFDKSTFIVMPTVAVTAPELGPLEASKELFHKTNTVVLRNTMVGNYFNLPGLTLPSGFDKDGLPTGILFNAYSGRDEELLCYGLSLEKVLQEAI